MVDYSSSGLAGTSKECLGVDLWAYDSDDFQLRSNFWVVSLEVVLLVISAEEVSMLPVTFSQFKKAFKCP